MAIMVGTKDTSSEKSTVGGQIEKSAVVDEEASWRASTLNKTQQQHTLDRNLLLSVVVPNSLVITICVLGLVYGRDQRVVVKNGTLQQTLAGWCVGLAVQASILPVVNLGRWVCQLWFAKQLATRGMRGRQMMSAWSALYSGSFRGLEDIFVGLSPIAIVLLVLYIGEVIVLGAIGSLYSLNPIRALRADGNIPLMTLMRTSTPKIDISDITDRIGAKFGELASPLQKQAVIPPDAWQISNVSCTSPYCTTTRYSIAHPYTRILHDLPDTVSLSSYSPIPIMKETVESNFTAFFVDVKCGPASDFSIYNSIPGGPGSSFYQIFRTEDMANPGVGLGTLYIMDSVTVPEVGFMPLFNWTDAHTPQSAVDPDVGMRFLVYGRNLALDGSTDFAKLVESSTDFTLYVAACDVKPMQGQASAGVYVAYARPEMITTIAHATPMPLTVLNDIIENSAVVSFITNLIGKINCLYQNCPSTQRAPWFDADFNLLSDAPTSEELENLLSTTVLVLADTTLMILSTFSILTEDTAHHEVYSDAISSVVQITHACTIVLLIGAACAAILIVLYLIYALHLSRDFNFNLGVRITDSVYDFIGSLDAPVGQATGVKEARESKVWDVKGALKKKTIRLVDGVGVREGVNEGTENLGRSTGKLLVV
ncbi:hypothetical protein HDV00_008677 [Rhizophlyctis rosea]|nr:hypothetical protein HDV00_008677 [Rhizophlyctis rosea]